MSFHFDTLKAIQAVAVILNGAPGKRLSYMSVIKMLYMADRESVAERGTPISGDKPVAMDHGPVLSEILDLIKGNAYEEQRALWSKYIRRRGYDIELLLDPGDGELSKFEVEKLEAVFREHGAKGQWELVQETHKFLEWQKTYTEGTSAEIHLKTLLDALDMGEEYDELSTKRIADAHFANLFGSQYLTPQPISAGDTFVTAGKSIPDHLWVVVSDPSQDNENVVLVNFTSHAVGKDDTCILKPGDHPFVVRDTSINYEQARSRSVKKIAEVNASNKTWRHEPVSDAVLSRIRKGMITSPDSPIKCTRILEAQGLVD